MTSEPIAYPHEDAPETASQPTAKRARGRRLAPWTLPGDVTVPISPRRTMSGLKTANLTPHKPVLAWLLVAESAAVQVLRQPGAAAGNLGLQAQEAVYRLMDEFRQSGLDRRGVVTAVAAAVHLVRFCQPENLRFADPGWVAGVIRDQEDSQDPTGAVQRLTGRLRVAWCPDEGPAGGLLLDRLHHTQHGGLLLKDTWMTRKVAEDLTAGRQLLGDRFLGVRVIAHRASLSSVHVVPTGTAGDLSHHHVLGGCRLCLPRVS